MEENKNKANIDKEEEINKKEKKEEIEDIEKMEELEENPGEVVIKLDENFKRHIEDKNFILDKKYKLNLKILYSKISQGKLLQNLDIIYYNNFATISYDNLTYIFFYK